MNEKRMRELLHDARNELCLYCGKYTESYLGACDGCKWASGQEWQTL